MVVIRHMDVNVVMTTSAGFISGWAYNRMYFFQFCLHVGGPITEGAYKRQFTVCVKTNKMDKFNKKWALPLDSVP